MDQNTVSNLDQTVSISPTIMGRGYVVNVAVVGNVDGGKSSTIGVIKNGAPDDGRGSARSSIMTLQHEKESGRTSSVNEVNVKIPIKGGGNRSICFLDLAGHEKYIKTTLCGLTMRFPDYALLCISLADGLSRVTMEHFVICKSLGIPMMVIFTKIDQCPSIEKMRECISEMKGFIKKVDRGSQFMPLNRSSDTDDIISKFSLAPSSIIPYMGISNVKYSNIDFMKEQLSKIVGFVRTGHIVKYCNEQNIGKMYCISRSYKVKGVGFVVHGLNVVGRINKGDQLFLGPVFGNYVEVRVKSIEDEDRNTVEYLDRDQQGCFALAPVNKKDDLMELHKKKMIKRGMVLTSKQHLIYGVKCNLYITKHSTTIRPGYRPFIHCGTVGVSATVRESSIEPMRSGNTATVTFMFESRKKREGGRDILVPRPQFAVPGSRLGMRDGKIKGFGKVIEVITSLPDTK